MHAHYQLILNLSILKIRLVGCKIILILGIQNIKGIITRFNANSGKSVKQLCSLTAEKA